jgi:fatty acid desaturase
MRCETHGLAAGPDGRCALCHRRDRDLARPTKRGRDPFRRAAIVIVAVAAGIAALALLLALFDTR